MKRMVVRIYEESNHTLLYIIIYFKIFYCKSLFPESQRFVLTDEGSLEIYNIHRSDSGSYICNVIYVHNHKHVTTEIRFMVYGKRSFIVFVSEMLLLKHCFFHSIRFRFGIKIHEYLSSLKA